MLRRAGAIYNVGVRIAVLGSGGVGGYFGGRLAASGWDVAFIARGAHLQALRTGGLHILSPAGDAHIPHVAATDNPADIGPVDFVFFTVKLYDTDQALGLLSPLVGSDTAVVPFQNGVETVERLVGTVGPAHTVGGTAYVAAVIAEPGVIRHTANQRLTFGELDGARSARLGHLLEVCRSSGIDAHLSDRIEADIWTKFVWLSMFSGVTAVTRSPIGEIRDDPDLVALCLAAALEGLAVAHAKGIHLPTGTLDDIVPSLHALPAGAKSSMLEDLERGRPLELPWLSGAVVRIGRELGVPTPTHRFITTVLKPRVNPNR